MSKCVSKSIVTAIVIGLGISVSGEAQAQSFYSSGHKGLCVDVKGGVLEEGKDIQLWTCHGRAPQLFQFDARTGKIHVQARPQLCIAVNFLPDGTADLILKDCKDASERWIIDAARKQVRARIANQDRCWDVPFGNTDVRRFRAGQTLIAYNCHGQINQQFVFNASAQPQPGPGAAAPPARQPPAPPAPPTNVLPKSQGPSLARKQIGRQGGRCSGTVFPDYACNTTSFQADPGFTDVFQIDDPLGNNPSFFVKVKTKGVNEVWMRWAPKEQWKYMGFWNAKAPANNCIYPAPNNSKEARDNIGHDALDLCVK